jgi:hypothetical protein
MNEAFFQGASMNNEPARTQNSSPLSRLPKKSNDAATFLPDDGQTEPTPAASAVQTAPKPASVSKGIKFNFGPPFWTIASVTSLSVNVILVIILILTWMSLPSLNFNSFTDLGIGLLGGLYTNFEKMDNAHITRTIPVDATIPVKFDLQLNQQTNVVLSQDVTINNALVTVNTGGLNITRALTTIVLPQGTILPVVLNLTVPVDATIPVSLNVEVDIPLNETQLHDPFVGLRKVVEPYYCMINPDALSLDGQPACP